MISDKVKAIIANSGIPKYKIADSLGISRQQLSNKFHNNTFTTADLVKICTACGYDITITDNKGTTFTLSDKDL